MKTERANHFFRLTCALILGVLFFMTTDAPVIAQSAGIDISRISYRSYPNIAPGGFFNAPGVGRVITDFAYTDLVSNGSPISSVPTNNVSQILDGPHVYPNPIQVPHTGTQPQIGYELSRNMDVEIMIFDMFSNKISHTYYPSGANGGVGTGTGPQTYNKVDITPAMFNGNALPSGVYFIVIKGDGNILGKGKFVARPPR